MPMKHLSGFLLLLFFPQLGCLRLQEELPNIGKEKWLRMKDLVKSLIKLAVVGDSNYMVPWRQYESFGIVWRQMISVQLLKELEVEEALHYFPSPGGKSPSKQWPTGCNPFSCEGRDVLLLLKKGQSPFFSWCCCFPWPWLVSFIQLWWLAV